MGLKTLIFWVMVLIFSSSTHQQTTPEERCTMRGNGTRVCVDCFNRATCFEYEDGSYGVIDAIACTNDPHPTYCDDTLVDPGFFGQCSPVDGSYTICSCESINQCIADPNNPAGILHCEQMPPPVTETFCPGSLVNLTTCSCSSCSDTCPLLDDPTDDCKRFFVCSGPELLPASCTSNLCFDQASCGCVEEPKCPPGCPFVDDPNDDCGSYFFCYGNGLIPVECSGTLCFDQQICGCVEEGASSTMTKITSTSTSTTAPTTKTTTKTTTTINPITCPPGCLLVDDPNDNCAKFFVCTGIELYPASCSGNLCFNQASCGCVERPTCPPDCPFVDDPNDDCGRYFFCDGDVLVPLSCPGTLCFYQDSCSCEEGGRSSIPTTITSTKKTTTTTPTTKTTPTTALTTKNPTTCPPGCPFVDIPDYDCTNFFVCTGTELVPASCTGNLCFSQESCGCVEKPTCLPDCPFVDDPNDDCGRYFFCNGDVLIPLSCSGTLCFYQDSCGCEEGGRSSIPTTITSTTTTTPRTKTTPTTTPTTKNPTTCPPGCPLVDDPDDDCANYFLCDENVLIPFTCPDTFCFDQDSCGCVKSGGSSLEPTGATIPPPLTCPPGCPFVDDPNDIGCSKFFICDGGTLIPAECPGILCFDQTACQCW